jgi:hypothetical protein
MMSPKRAMPERGQVLVLFTLSLVALLLVAGLVVDVGLAYAKQRGAQTAADFAAMAGTRILGQYYTGQPTNAGTDANVEGAVTSLLVANNATLVSWQYVDNAGNALTRAPGTIPNGAAGVVVKASTTWHPAFLGVIGVNSWSAGVQATATTPTTSGGGVLPIGIQDSAFDGMPLCDPTAADYATCLDTNGGNLTSGTLYAPGQFGWLKFGARGKCTLSNGTPFGLGMSTTSGCESSQGFLQGEVGPPANSYGCCTSVDANPSTNYIGGMTGNKPADLSYYINHHVTVILPVWDQVLGNGANAYYHIVGFAAFVLTGLDTQHGKWLTGVRVSSTVASSPSGLSVLPSGRVTLVH